MAGLAHLEKPDVYVYLWIFQLMCLAVAIVWLAMSNGVLDLWGKLTSIGRTVEV